MNTPGTPTSNPAANTATSTALPRRDFVLGLLAATAASATATGCALRPPKPAPLRVLSYNLHHGEGVDGRLDLERIAAVIRSANPDLVVLQEVDRNATRTGGVDQPAEYARLTGLHGWYGAAMPFQGGEYGQALLARWPLQEPRVVRLPGTPGSEPRIAVTAVIDIPRLGRVRLAGVHLDASRADNDRWDQAGALLDAFGHDGLPTLLAGDFNATPESRVMQRLLADNTPWEDTAGASPEPTIPAENPRSRIDFILASPRGAWRVAESRVIPEAVASDHRPVLAILEWQPAHPR
jgi:endonuclease/exonuclease/phosphatase family metal-dependent hydrolase